MIFKREKEKLTKESSERQEDISIDTNIFDYLSDESNVIKLLNEVLKYDKENNIFGFFDICYERSFTINRGNVPIVIRIIGLIKFDGQIIQKQIFSIYSNLVGNCFIENYEIFDVVNFLKSHIRDHKIENILEIS
jgi:hypothetical protein